MDASFQQIVLTFAIIFLIFILVVIGYSLTNSKTDVKWPPIVANCPDYWEDVTADTVMDGSVTCKNSKNIGICNLTNVSNVINKNFAKTETPCNKYTWATNCGSTWDGITYGYGQYKPCDTKPPNSL